MDIVIRLTEVEFNYTKTNGDTLHSKRKGDMLSKRDLALSVLDVANTDKKEDMQLKLTFQLHALLPDKTIKSEGITFSFDGENESLVGIFVTLIRFMNKKIKAYDNDEDTVIKRLASHVDRDSPSGLKALFASEIEVLDITEVFLRYVRGHIKDIVMESI